ncbi:hypothetical protein JIQ42_04259 [Leishmania sp. Namibia]|uniref:hypothetical protein n=1 Tax=Leishmania sp. Namibia TaxID=2802991 RepID=UPI001B3DDD2D|nr:hypothetical protein JIQ42_04259 [Leishmania sp. Namibia]
MPGYVTGSGGGNAATASIFGGPFYPSSSADVPAQMSNPGIDDLPHDDLRDAHRTGFQQLAQSLH